MSKEAKGLSKCFRDVLYRRVFACLLNNWASVFYISHSPYSSAITLATVPISNIKIWFVELKLKSFRLTSNFDRMGQSDLAQSRNCTSVVSTVSSISQTVDQSVALLQWLNLGSENNFQGIKYFRGSLLKYFTRIKLFFGHFNTTKVCHYRNKCAVELAIISGWVWKLVALMSPSH